MPDTSATTDGNRKRSRSPSDAEQQKQHKRANTGAPTSQQQDDSTQVALDESTGTVPTTTQASLNDVAMTEQSASANINDTTASTPTDSAAPADPVNGNKSTTASSTERASGDEAQSGDAQGAGSATTSAPPTPSAMIHMRCLIVTQDASIIIGRGGKHVNEIREKSGARVVVSESIPGNPERILNVSGPLDAVSKVSHTLVYCYPHLLSILCA